MNSDPIRPKDRFLVFGSPAIEEEIREVTDSIRRGWLGTDRKPPVVLFLKD